MEEETVAPEVNEEVIEGAQDPSPGVVEETPAEEVQPEEAVEEPEGEQEEQPISRRQSKRLQQVLDKLAEYDKSQTRPAPPSRAKNEDPIIPEGEYDIDQINEMAQKYGEQRYREALTQAETFQNASTFATRLEIDSPKVNAKYDFLDPESENFNPGVASFANRMYLNTVGYDPKNGVVRNLDIRYPEFVDGLMDMLDMVSTVRVADATKNVSKQAAQTGIRPGGSRAQVYSGNDPKKMTDEQLKKAIESGMGI